MNPEAATENGESASLNEILNFKGATEDNLAGSKFLDGIQSKHGLADIPAAKISELMKLNSLQGASTHSLFSVVSNILDDSIERKNGDIPQCVASLVKLVVQEIEERVSKQADNLRKQNGLYKSREERYQSRVKALETLAVGTTEEHEVIMKKLQQIKIEKAKIEEKEKLQEKELIRLMEENDHYKMQISSLIAELESSKQAHEKDRLQLEAQAEQTRVELENRILELQRLLSESTKKVQELEAFSESKLVKLKRRELGYKHFIDCHFGSLQELRVASDSIRLEVMRTKEVYIEELNHFGFNLKGLVDAAQNYHTVLEENRKLYNEVQDLKGNIRVYCRIRPFLRGQSQKLTTIEYIGENGELVVTNPSKPGKESHRLFKFNKVFVPAVTQEEVFRDTQPLIRSVLDGYNVCIFAYGQTGSGKTYTMSGPSMSSVEDWGVNYRALNDLFNISQSRKSSIAYEVGVQMVEIYNEQVRDLLCSDASQKRLGIWSTTQPNGLAVPDASMHPVKSTANVLELMNIGLMNRAVGATALNERSSRSHSILTVHVRGVDLETNDILRGCLHLVDLAGSERVDRSEATGDRLREAQHINKSLSALGDVIFALAQKSAHVPYRNSKLTQVLQSSLGGQAKTLMFVQLNPDVESYSETISTLKFAERVSGVELGAARNNKEGRGVKELMDQVANLKDTIVKKDEEIGRLRVIKTNGNGERRSVSSTRHGSASPRRHSLGGPRASQIFSGERSSGPPTQKATSDADNSSECSDRQSDTGSQQSMDDFRHHRDFFRQSRLAVVDAGLNLGEDTVKGAKNPNEDVVLIGFDDADSEERLSDISDGVLSMGTETDGSINSIVEYTLFPETAKQPSETPEKPSVPAKLPRPTQKKVETGSSRLSSMKKSTPKVPSSKKPPSGNSSAVRSSKRWQ
ncbi:kinesin-like protein KIN-14J [Lycium ferocissimum]|uniref:kinesin-like protein KIN-14J n=1 Tax=Lycium ferocissimum TaxID=112874 RepID=UPI002814E9D0|nr:kinesin-like protein KIN-14J [Lycium ferocissimum]XP_059276176.1 kinesin-like protein KIN-14J [Lycium ferocissimum]XP_059276177.1 kinesin-like protein KIN-14J [Lycium ferocissimum]